MSIKKKDEVVWGIPKSESISLMISIPKGLNCNHLDNEYKCIFLDYVVKSIHHNIDVRCNLFKTPILEDNIDLGLKNKCLACLKVSGNIGKEFHSTDFKEEKPCQ